MTYTLTYCSLDPSVQSYGRETDNDTVTLPVSESSGAENRPSTTECYKAALTTTARRLPQAKQSFPPGGAGDNNYCYRRP